MSERRVVRPMGRQVYGRQPAAGRAPRKPVRWSGLSLLQRRALLLVVLILAVGFWLSQEFAVRQITVQAPSGGTSIQAAAEAAVQASSWSGNLLTLDQETLSTKIQQADPALRSLTIKRQWPHTLAIAAVLQQPSLGWVTNGQVYLLDHDGTVIGAFPNGSSLPAVTDKSNLPVTPGKQVVSTQFVTFVQALAPGLTTAGYKVTGMSIQDTTFDLAVTTNKGYSLIFDTTRPVSGELADLKTVQSVLVAQKQAPTSYIDLRISGKVYYK